MPIGNGHIIYQPLFTKEHFGNKQTKTDKNSQTKEMSKVLSYIIWVLSGILAA